MMAAVTLGSKSIGSTVKIKIDGEACAFVVVHHGCPSDIYHSSCDGTWVWAKKSFHGSNWHENENLNYASSLVHKYLNSTFLSRVDAEIAEQIKQVKIPYAVWASSNHTSSAETGSNGLDAKCFVLSVNEMVQQLTGTYTPAKEGSCLEYFSSDDAESKRANGTNYWTRTPWQRSDSHVYAVHKQGGVSDAYVKSFNSIVPAFILPDTLFVADDGMLYVNNPPVITSTSGTSGVDLGIKKDTFALSYTVSDTEGGEMDVVEMLDGKKIRSFKTTGGTYSHEAISPENFIKILNGDHTLRVTADDGKDVATYEAKFTKAVHSASITLKTPLAVEGDITIAITSMIDSIPADATYKVEVTNNANDANPVWQDVTEDVKTGTNILFENTSCTNGAAFNFRISVSRGASGQGGHISVVSGAFQ